MTSPSSLKRSRDYGAELKGLPSEDEDERPSPVAKRTRRQSSDTEDNLPTVADPETSATQQTGSTVPTGTGGWNRGLSLGTRTSFGKAKSQATAPEPPRTTSLIRRSPSSSPPPQDKEKGVVTPAAASTPNDVESATDEKAHGPYTFLAEKHNWVIPRRPATEIPDIPELSNPSYWLEKLKIWLVVIIQANPDHQHKIGKGTIRTGFDNYTGIKARFLPGSKKVRKTAKAAMEKTINSLSTQKLEELVSEARTKVDTAKAAGRDAVDDLEAQVETLEAPRTERDEKPAEPQHPASQSEESDEGEVHESDPEPEPDSDDEQLQLYFPSAADPSQFCLHCSRTGHKSRKCPYNVCDLCRSPDHSTLGCPVKGRCSKCFQLGHTLDTCTEKLAAPAGEREACVVCSDENHIERDCPQIWRSYDPHTATIYRVAEIPTFCYTCGRKGHYGPECGLPGRKHPDPASVASPTWSAANRDLYVDPHDQESVAVSLLLPDTHGAGNVYSSSAAPSSTFQIRGRAGPRATHTHFVSSDDSDDDGFLREPLQRGKRGGNSGRPPQRGGASQRGGGGGGGIRIATNIGAPGTGGSNGLPPLPPGPPPSLSRNSDNGGYHPLPPRPGGNNSFGGRPPPRGGRGGGSGSGRGGGGRGGRGRGRGGGGYR